MVLSATREWPGAVAAEQRSVRGDAGLNPTARLRRPSDDDFGATTCIAVPAGCRFRSCRRFWAGADDATGAGAMFVAVAPAVLEPGVMEFWVEIVPCGGTYDVYRKGRLLRRTSLDLSSLFIAATEGNLYRINLKQKT